jgi:hypothetical protein
MARSATILLAGAGVALAAPVSAQLLARKDISAAIAISIAQTAIETCKTNGYAVSGRIPPRTASRRRSPRAPSAFRPARWRSG